MERIYLNLTNGLEWLEEYPDAGFVRIPSTWCEQKRWDAMLCGLGAGFWMDLARGESVVVLDCGARKATSRAIWQGVPFISAAAKWYWLGERAAVKFRGNDATAYAHRVIQNLDAKTDSMLRYYRRFYSGCGVSLSGRSRRTERDGDYAFYADIVSCRREIAA